MVGTPKKSKLRQSKFLNHSRSSNIISCHFDDFLPPQTQQTIILNAQDVVPYDDKPEVVDTSSVELTVRISQIVFYSDFNSSCAGNLKLTVTVNNDQAHQFYADSVQKVENFNRTQSFTQYNFDSRCSELFSICTGTENLIGNFAIEDDLLFDDIATGTYTVPLKNVLSKGVFDKWISLSYKNQRVGEILVSMLCKMEVRRFMSPNCDCVTI